MTFNKGCFTGHRFPFLYSLTPKAFIHNSFAKASDLSSSLLALSYFMLSLGSYSPGASYINTPSN